MSNKITEVNAKPINDKPLSLGRKVASGAAAITAIAMIVMAMVLVAGTFGNSAGYCFAGAGFAVGSISLLVFAVALRVQAQKYDVLDGRS